jgi:hypothetical protein
MFSYTYDPRPSTLTLDPVARHSGDYGSEHAFVCPAHLMALKLKSSIQVNIIM